METQDLRSDLQYDEQGNMVLEEVDNGVDGIVDVLYLHTYDASGNKLSSESQNASGVVVARESWTYDAQGNVLSHIEDRPAGGAVEHQTTFAYDALGHRTLAEGDDTDDGLVDWSVSYTYSAGCEGLVVLAGKTRSAGTYPLPSPMGPGGQVGFDPQAP